MTLRIFYSWQSDTANATNRGFIHDSLERALAELQQDNDLTMDAVIDRDTAGIPGAPDIGTTIFAKIDNCAAFVCDVSIIHPEGHQGRRTPNPNVLVELGYALKTLGHPRIVLVMNSAYGGPELLPFDLKQKRAITYNLATGDITRPAAKKDLTARLAQALKAILDHHTAATLSMRQKTLLEEAISGVNEGRSDQRRRIKAYAHWLADELKKLNGKRPESEDDENLVRAIEASTSIVRDFGTLADAIALRDAKEAAQELYRGFEGVLSLYEPAPGFSGSFSQVDFDFFKFVGHELFVVLCGVLGRDEHWATLDAMLETPLHVETYRGDKQVGFPNIDVRCALLDDVRSKRLASGGTRRISIHADLLKERHDVGGPLHDTLSWRDFLDTEIALYLRSFVQHPGVRSRYWWPRSWVYLGSARPRFLSAATSRAGAAQLAMIIGVSDLSQLRARARSALRYLNEGLQEGAMFGDSLSFDPDTIAEP